MRIHSWRTALAVAAILVGFSLAVATGDPDSDACREACLSTHDACVTACSEHDDPIHCESQCRETMLTCEESCQ